MSIADELQMIDYWIGDKGLERALEVYAPEINTDPAIQAARIQMENGERAIRQRIEELREQHGEDA